MSEVEGLDGLNDVLIEVGDSFADADYTPVLEKHKVDLEELHGQYFSQSAGPDGSPWQKLAPATVRRKGHDTILVDTGQMRASLQRTTSDSIRTIQREGANNRHDLVFGTADEKSPFHNRGAGNLPQRIHVGTTEDLVDKLANDTANAAVEAMKE